MFEKLGRLAEVLARDVGTSRRGFLGRVGKSALGVGRRPGGAHLHGVGPVRRGRLLQVQLPEHPLQDPSCPEGLPSRGHHLHDAIYSGIDPCKLKETTAKSSCTKC